MSDRARRRHRAFLRPRCRAIPSPTSAGSAPRRRRLDRGHRRHGARRHAAFGLFMRVRRDDQLDGCAARGAGAARRARSHRGAARRRRPAHHRLGFCGGAAADFRRPARARRRACRQGRVPRLRAIGSAAESAAEIDAAADKLRREGDRLPDRAPRPLRRAARSDRPDQRPALHPAASRADRRAPLLRRARRSRRSTS